MRNTSNPTPGQMDELHQTIRDFAKRGIKESDVKGIGKQFDNGTKRYDLRKIDDKYTEYKNKDFAKNPLTPGSNDVDQFINGYLKNIESIDDLEWKVGLDKLQSSWNTQENALAEMKKQWKSVFISKADEMFKPISEGGLGLDKMKSLFGADVVSPVIFKAKLNNKAFLDNVLRFLRID